MSKNKSTLRIEYVKNPEFRDVFATGAYGSVGPRGDIYFVLMTDRMRTPETEEMLMDEQGRVEEVRTFVSDKGQIVREAQIGVHMTAEAAESLAAWLMQKVEEQRRNRGGGGSH